MLAVVQQNNIYRLPFLRFLNLAILFCRQLDSIHLKNNTDWVRKLAIWKVDFIISLLDNVPNWVFGCILQKISYKI